MSDEARPRAWLGRSVSVLLTFAIVAGALTIALS